MGVRVRVRLAQRSMVDEDNDAISNEDLDVLILELMSPSAAQNPNGLLGMEEFGR